MRGSASGPGGWAVGLGLVMVPVASHAALASQQWPGLAGILAVLQSVLVAGVGLSFVANRALRWAGGAAVLAGSVALWRLAPPGASVALALPHAMAYIGLLAFFGASLAPGREAVITRLARKIRGPLPKTVERYTRRVTLAWCGFFVLQLLGSLALLRFAPPAVWSLFVNVLNLPLVIAMFGAEYAYRQYRHGSHPGERVGEMLRVFRKIRAAGHEAG